MQVQDTINMHERLASLETAKKDYNRRLSVLEDTYTTIQQLATSTSELALSMSATKDTVEKIDERVAELESVPKKRYEGFVMSIITGIAAAILGYLLGHGGV